MQKHSETNIENDFEPTNSKMYTPTIGMINNIKTLDCHISLSTDNHSHKFTVNYKPLNIFSLLIKRRLGLGFEKIVSMTYELKVKETNVFIPEALLNGDGEVIHEYKKLLEKGRIESYIKLNIRKEEVNREKRARPVSMNDKDNRVSFEELSDKKMIIANFNEKNTIANKNEETEQHTVKKLSISRHEKILEERETQKPLFKSSIFQPSNTENYLSPPAEFREEIHHHHSFYHHKKTKKVSQSVANKSEKKNSFSGIKINYYEVKSNAKENPEMATYVFPNMGININKSGVKSVRENQDAMKSTGKHSTLKTEMIDIQNTEKNRTDIDNRSSEKKHIYPLTNNQHKKSSPIKNVFEMDKFSIRSQKIQKPETQKIKINSSLYVDNDFENEEKKMSNILLGDELISGSNLMIGQRNIVKKKSKISTAKNIDWMNGFEMNMV